MDDLTYQDFRKDLYLRTDGNRIPFVGQLELTFRCNLRCAHCYIPERHGQQELGFQEWAGILDQISKAGCLWLSLTGGDPLMREDFLEIYRYAREKGFLITLMTNGTQMTPGLARILADEPPFSIEVSINGVTREIYERISRVPGSFIKAMKAVDLILDGGLPLKIKTKVTRTNIEEVDDIRRFVEERGLEFKPDTILYPRLDGSLEPCQYRLSVPEIERMEMTYQTEQKCVIPRSGEEWEPPDFLYRCAAGLNSFHISPSGELILCTFVRQPSFCLKEGSFKLGFSTFFPSFRALRYRSRSLCRTCRIFDFCSQCPGAAKLENDDQEKPISHFCQLAHRRAGLMDEKNERV